MKVTRLFTGSDGRSHFEDCSPETRPDRRETRAATGVFLHEFPAGTVLDWHPSPRRQFVVVVSGRLELDVGEGEPRRFGPGDVRIMEDTTGRGHTTRVIGDEPAVLAVVALTPAT